MASAQYRPAPQVRKIAEELIPKYHQHLIDYAVKLEYVFVDKTPKSKGREVWGTCRKLSSLNAFLANEQEGSDPFFVIVISEPVWEVLPPDKRVALIDHELCHAWAEASQKEDGDGSEDVIKLSVRPHDCEAFVAEIRRHGLWREDIEDLVEAALKNRRSGDATGHDKEVSGT
jgi:predicted metallopeptidase